MSDGAHHDLEIEAAGGLAELLRRELSARAGPVWAEGLDATTPGSRHWAELRVGDRSASATSAGALYLAGFWESHVHLAHLKSGELASLVAALSAWLIDWIPASELARSVPDVELEEMALAYEAGPAAYIADCWARFRAQFAEGAAAGRWWEEALLPVVEMAAADPLIRQMRPFTSVIRFGVWRGLGPDDDSLPLIVPRAPGWFALCTYDDALLAEGTGREVLDRLAEYVRAGGEPGQRPGTQPSPRP